jgi:hypothetical protein
MKWQLGMLVIILAGFGIRVLAAEPEAPKGDERAAALMAEATKNRYTWSQNVTGLSGKFVWKSGDKSVEGSFRYSFRKPRGLKLETEDAEVKEQLQSLLSSRIGHRSPSDGPSDPVPMIIVVEDDEHGPLIMPVGDALHSTQRVKDGKLVQINRMMGGKRFTIDTTAYEKSSDGRFFPTAFTVTWWDAKTGKRLEKQLNTTQGFYVVEGQMFPKAEKLVNEKDGKTTTVEIQYSDIKFDLDSGRSREK